MLGTCFVPAGTRIILSLQGVHHRADLWPEPKTFRAERFLPGKEIDTYSFLSFIQGPRNCLGQYLALLEARVVLGVLTKVRSLARLPADMRMSASRVHRRARTGAQRFKFRPAFPETGRIDSKMIPIGPAGGMHMLVT